MVQKIFILIFLSISFFFVLPANGSSSKYYVSLEGTNTNNGNSKAPFRTIARGVSVLKAGDTLIVKAGNYGYEKGITITNSGMKENPIVIMAEKPGTVFLVGPRKEGEEDCLVKNETNVYAITIKNSSYIIVDGFHISNYAVGVVVDGLIKDNSAKPHHVTVKRCILKKNGEAGVQVSRMKNVLIEDCQFISDKIKKNDGKVSYLVSIQDYGCNFYNSISCVVENNYFYGAHHQSVSFKEGDKDCTVRKNIFEGAQYTAIYLGQNRRADASVDNQNPTCSNLLAEYNIVRPAKGYRVKSPLRVENVRNAVVRYNYFEGFDETNKTAGINVWDEALGKIEIYNNILAFSRDNKYSGGVCLELGGTSDTKVIIYHNTFYKVVQDLFLDRYRGDDTEGYRFEKNISYQCNYNSLVDKDNYRGDPQFIYGDPLQRPISSSPVKPDFDSYYKKLTEPFRLKENSPAKGFGVEFK